MKKLILVCSLLTSSIILIGCTASTGVAYGPAYSTTYTSGLYTTPTWGYYTYRPGLGYYSGYRWGNRWGNRWYGRTYWGGGRGWYGGRGYYRGWYGRGHRHWGRRW